MSRRASGVLLHVTSLPSRDGIVALDLTAYHFMAFLAKSKPRSADS